MKKYFLPIAIALALLAIWGCTPETEQVIMTVNGPIPSGEMGITLVHEHVLVDFIGADSTGYHRWNKKEAEDRIVPFLTEIQDHEVKTFIECTPAFIGRDPFLLKMLSERTGMQLVTNTGFYGARQNKYIPASFYRMTAEEIAAGWIDEFENGIEESGVRPGFIKIGVDASDTLSPEHIKIISAAALAHNRTGLVIASHTGPEGPAFAQIKVLQSYGINPSHFIWVHAQRGTLEGNIKAAESGAWISLDNVNAQTDRSPDEMFSTDWYADRIAALKEAGLLARVLISHDAGWYSPGQENGGNFRGFTDIFTALIPALKQRGVSEEDINQLMILNPQDAYSILQEG